ncbi:MAG: liaS 2 [Bryobacterales bacterium]|nr:liaS 2 [Bryobacterales bacterium]
MGLSFRIAEAILPDRLEPFSSLLFNGRLAQNIGSRKAVPARWILVIALSTSALLFAERLPIRAYTTADGLPSNSVGCIVPDSRGFLWLCTWDGLVRFDGYTFANYSLDQGIPDRHVTALLETRKGRYWVGTYNGVARFEPDLARLGKHPFIRYSIPGSDASQHITALVEDREGSIWCGTHNGIYRLAHESNFEPVDIGLPQTNWKSRFVQSMAVDREGALWVATEGSGLWRRRRDGGVDWYNTPTENVSAVALDRHGQIWAGTSSGICLFGVPKNTSAFTLQRVYRSSDGLPNVRIKALLENPDGSIWAATENGIAQLPPGAERFTPWGARHGIQDTQTRALGMDAEGNLWIASESSLMRLARSGFIAYDITDGLGGNQVISVFEDRDGDLCVINGIRQLFINRLEGNRFTAVQPRLIRQNKRISYFGWGVTQTVLQDHMGDWWIPTGEGLCRFSGVKRVEDLARVRPRAVYTRSDGLPGNDIFRLFEDSRGDLWVGTADTPGLARWQRRTARFQRAEGADGYDSRNPPAAFAEDRAGDIWVGFFWKGLARYRNGRWRTFSTKDGIPDGSLWNLLVDRRGRLWIASSNDGLTRVDDPSADVPRFSRYSTRQGLSTDLLRSLAEDRQGIIYIGTELGVDALNPESGHVRHFSFSDGLAAGDLVAAFCDRTGALWFGASLGLSRLMPEPERRPKPPPVRITALRIAGVLRPFSALGETALAGLELDPNQNHVEVEFASFNFRTAAAIRYQYRLEGTGSDWTEPADARSVNLVGLAPGSYRFQVRAIREGIVSSPPAEISFHILGPIWRRWWAISAALLFIGSLVYAAHRYRVAQLIQMEKVRTRIAMDLHDDIGSSLSQISILSEVARRDAAGSAASVQSLSRVAEISRDLVDALGDIVWAVNPHKDLVGDLVQRMRRFGGDVLNSRNIEFDCRVPEAVLGMELEPDIRRQVFLIFKESVHNIARHSGCRYATAELALRGRHLLLTIADDGAGFDQNGHGGEGHGLASMRKRAAQLGAELRVTSQRGQGTTIGLTLPLRSHYLNR